MTDQETAERFATIMQDTLLTLDPTLNFTWKRMFGGAGYYANGQIIAAWFGGDSIALKLPEEERTRLLQEDGAQPGMSKQYIEVPPAWMNDVEQLAAWVGKSVAYVKTLPVKKKRSS